MSDDEREEKELDLTSPEVVTKGSKAGGVGVQAKAKIVDFVKKEMPLSKRGPATGRAADVLAAANTAAEVALRLVRPGKKNSDVTEAIQKVAAAYDCRLLRCSEPSNEAVCD
ncbi:hypothetical protein HAX54_007543 [Datura stramonium]|uniref:Uncharacterized protein n=1 Tax=Datura stramonium TaxID=4076 RepID=A0ABS8TC01_DATST|nr:hypothetical protein [Datura stramonium]